MKFFNTPIFLTILFLFSVSFISCNRDDDEGPNPNNEVIELSNKINGFIFTGLYNYYLWKKEVPKLTDSYWSFSTQAEFENAYNSFISGTNDHELFFNDLLYKKDEVDKFSMIVDDYEVLENTLDGITLSMGYNFILYKYSNSNNIFGVVLYVLKNSPACAKGLKRGDLFTSVDGELLNVDNYQDLLTKETYTLTLADISNGSIVPNNQRISMTAIQIAENPVFLDSIYSVSNKKIGYLIYNGFYSDYDIELNNVFKNFKDNNINELILDLRYNPGGSVQSSTYLASMIYGPKTDEIYLKKVYNEGFQEYLTSEYGADYLLVKFTDRILNEDSTFTTINSLNLSKVYIITTNLSASASEAVVNGLRPHMTVKTIGTTTYGKYVGSITLKDYDENGVLNSKHRWAMQPIVSKISNSADVSDYYNGLVPDIKIEETITNLSVLGNIYEPLLKTAINTINGTPVKKSTQASGFEKIADSKDIVPFGKEMYLNIK